MATFRLGGFALSAAATFITVVATHASAQIVTNAAFVDPINLPGATVRGTASYDANTLLWTYRYDVAGVNPNDFYHLYIYEEPTHAGLHDEINFQPGVGVGTFGTENVTPGPARPGFNANNNHYYHGGTLNDNGQLNVYSMSFQDTHGPGFAGWALSGVTANYPIHNGFEAIPVPRVPAPASVAMLAAGLLAARRRR